jgi:anti-sigma B factor antagonist
MFLSKYENNICIITITETNKLDAFSAPELRSYIVNIINNGSENIIIDLDNISFIDSSALGAIVSIMKILRNNGKLMLTGVNGIVLDLFKLTRMDNVLNLYSDVDSAKQSLL